MKDPEHFIEVREMHLIIDWLKTFAESEIITDIKDCGLELIKIINIDKLENSSKTLTKFYNIKVDDFRGKQDFKIYIVKCPIGFYDYRNTSKGNRLVNTKLFDLKQILRKKSGHSHSIHATDNIQETKDNLKALELYEKHYERKEFKDISEVFDVLNGLKNFKYVIMRNFEGIPDDIIIDEHLDIDLLVSDYYMAKAMLDATSVYHGQLYDDGQYRILNSILIEGKEVWFDLRYIGDSYYDIELEKRMLNKRIILKNFFIPDEKTHLYTLIYHALVHKTHISNTYKTIFIESGISKENINKNFLGKLLDGYMIKNGFEYVKPKDKTVGYHYNGH
jgi:hypothetical protein